MNIANINRPKLFSEYLGQKGAVNYIKSAIKNNKHPSGIIISGCPGLGKSSLAHLYSKATLCENRLEGEVEACGVCDSCTSDIEKGGHANITYYRITEASVFKEAVNDLISMTKASPVITHDNIREDNNRRFIIIDELQNCLAGDTLILTEEGLIPIKDKNILGKKVLSFNETNLLWEYKKVIAHIPNNKQDTIEIETEKGTIVCTKNHKIKTQVGWKPAEEINFFDKIHCPALADADNYILKLLKIAYSSTILNIIIKAAIKSLQKMEANILGK